MKIELTAIVNLSTLVFVTKRLEMPYVPAPHSTITFDDYTVCVGTDPACWDTAARLVEVFVIPDFDDEKVSGQRLLDALIERGWKPEECFGTAEENDKIESKYGEAKKRRRPNAKKT
jgi:hypothetical protein